MVCLLNVFLPKLAAFWKNFWADRVIERDMASKRPGRKMAFELPCWRNEKVKTKLDLLARPEMCQVCLPELGVTIELQHQFFSTLLRSHSWLIRLGNENNREQFYSKAGGSKFGKVLERWDTDCSILYWFKLFDELQCHDSMVVLYVFLPEWCDSIGVCWRELSFEQSWLLGKGG